MATCPILSPPLAFHFKHTPKVGVYRENFNIGNLAHNFLWSSIYVGSVPFHFQRNLQWESFHRQRQRHRHRRPTHFLKFGWKMKIIFFGAKKKFRFVFLNTYLISGTNVDKEVCYWNVWSVTVFSALNKSVFLDIGCWSIIVFSALNKKSMCQWKC